jgi:hypothetical protein
MKWQNRSPCPCTQQLFRSQPQATKNSSNQHVYEYLIRKFHVVKLLHSFIRTGIKIQPTDRRPAYNNTSTYSITTLISWVLQSTLLPRWMIPQKYIDVLIYFGLRFAHTYTHIHIHTDVRTYTNAYFILSPLHGRRGFYHLFSKCINSSSCSV